MHTAMANAMNNNNSSAMGNSFVMNNSAMSMNLQHPFPMSNDSYARHVVLDKRGIPVTLGGSSQAPPFSPAARNQRGQRQTAAVTPALTSKPAKPFRASPPDSGIRYRRVDPFAESSYATQDSDHIATRLLLGSKPNNVVAPQKKAAKAPQPLHHSLNLYYAPQPDANLDSFGRTCGESVSPAWKGKRKWRMICS